MNNDYGYFLKSIGYDGDHIDVFLGNDFDSKKIFVVDQKINGKFDESKVMFGFKTSNEAKKAYLSNYEKNWKGFHKITEVDEGTFKSWLYDGKKQRKAFSDYKIIKELNNKNMKINLKESDLREKIENIVREALIKENIGWSNDTWDMFEMLNESLGSERLAREIAGKVDEYTLKSILKTIAGHYGLFNDEE